jgi:hypothetical protein
MHIRGDSSVVAISRRCSAVQVLVGAFLLWNTQAVLTAHSARSA